jgi:hypothetical protein
MRATRAYIAGFGTAGSLVAGAAIVFVLASTVVAFRGWPQVSSEPALATLVASPLRPTPSSPTGRRLAQVAASLRAATPVARPGAPSTAATATAVASSTSQHAQVVSPQLGAQTGRPATIAPPTIPGGGPCTACDAVTNLTAPVAPTVASATGVVGSTVANTGQTLGATVSGVANVLASKLAGISAPLASAVSRTGAAVGATINGVSSAAGAVVSGTGTALGNLLSGHKS